MNRGCIVVPHAAINGFQEARVAIRFQRGAFEALLVLAEAEEVFGARDPECAPTIERHADRTRVRESGFRTRRMPPHAIEAKQTTVERCRPDNALRIARDPSNGRGWQTFARAPVLHGVLFETTHSLIDMSHPELAGLLRKQRKDGHRLFGIRTFDRDALELHAIEPEEAIRSAEP